MDLDISMEKVGGGYIVDDGCGGSLSSSFKRKISVTESSSTKDTDTDTDTLYVGDGGIPFGKRARYKNREDSEVVQEMYGLTSYAKLVSLIESTYNQIVSPNLRFTYGAEPYTRPSDPRIGDMAILKAKALMIAQSRDRTAIMMSRGPVLNRRAALGRKAREAIFARHGLKPDFNRPPPKGDEEEKCRKLYEIWEGQEQELLNARDLRMAARGLTCFNLKFKTDYMVEEVLGSQKIDIEQNLFYHCNFIARSKKGSQQRLFFAEIRNACEVNVCCILDDGVRGCRFCGDEFVHPSEKGLLAVS